MEYLPDRESVDSHRLPDWYHDAKFGIFVHWSLSCVPAYAPSDRGNTLDILRNEGSRSMFVNQPCPGWYLNSLRIKGSPAWKHHLLNYGLSFDYYRFADEFNRELDRWDPGSWADLFKEAGAKYVILVTKHHDGFLLWPSHHRNPARPELHASRNVVEELSRAVRDRGMKMGFYYSSPYDWTFTEKPVTDLATGLLRTPFSREYRDYACNHWYELIDRYLPSVLWSDIGFPSGVNTDEIVAYFYNRVPDGVVNDRWEQSSPLLRTLAFLPGFRQAIDRYARRALLQEKVISPRVHHDFSTPEYATPDGIAEEKWECARGIGRSFGYNREEEPGDFPGDDELVHMLSDIVSRNGNLLLGVGPMPGGEIPGIQVDRLRAVGRWLAANSEAVYGTRPWIRAEGSTSEGMGVRFTCRDGSLYAIILGTPGSPEVDISPLVPAGETRVELLGSPAPLGCEHLPRGLRVRFPEQLPPGPATCLKVSPVPTG